MSRPKVQPSLGQGQATIKDHVELGPKNRMLWEESGWGQMGWAKVDALAMGVEARRPQGRGRPVALLWLLLLPTAL